MADDVNIVVRVRDATRAGISEVNARLTTLVRQASQMDKSFGSVKGAAVSLAPALIPIAAAAAPIVAGMGAAAVAVGAFGAAIGPQIGAMGDAAKAEEKYTEAVEKHGKSSQEAAKAEQAYLASVQKLPPATREAAAALSVMKEGYEDWSNALAADTMPVVTKGIGVLGGLFPKLTPVVKGASQELNRFVTIAAGGIQSSAFDRFMRSFADFSTGALQKANDGLVRLTRTLDTGKVGGAIGEFMQYARENGPLVGDTLQDVATALMKLLVAASDVGVGMLTVVNAFAGLVAALPTGLVSTLLQVAIAFKAVKLAAAGFSAVSTGILALSTQIVAMRTAAGGATGTLASLTAAFGALSRGAKLAVAATGIGLLVVALVELMEIGQRTPADMDRMSTALGKFGQTGKATGELARVVGKDFKEFNEALRGMARPSGLDQVQQSITDFFGMDSTPVKKWKGVLDDVDKGLSNLVKSGNAQLAAQAFDEFAKHAQAQGLTTEELRTQLDDYKAALADAAFEQKLAAESMGLFGAQAQAVQGKLEAQKQSTDGLRESIHALNNVVLMMRGGMRGMEAAIDAAAKAAQENGKTLDINTEKGRANSEALDNLATATMKAAEGARESGASWTTVNGIYERGKGQLIAVAQQMGLTEAQAKKLADQILKTPNKTATLKGDITDLKAKIKDAQARLKNAPMSKKAAIRAELAALKRDLANAQAAINRLHGTTITSHHYLVKHYDNIEDFRGAHGRAHGGIIGAAGGGPRSRMTLVGEQGPELVDLAPGSRVRSNPDTRRMMGGYAGGQAAVLQVNLVVDGKTLATAIVEPQRELVRTRAGGNVQKMYGQRGA